MLKEHQKNAITALKENIDQDNKRLVVQMTQGSGLQATCLFALNELKQIYKWKKIKIICDRLEVIEQIKHTSQMFKFDNSEIIFSCLSSSSGNKEINSNIDKSNVIVLLNIHRNFKIIDDYISNFKGIIIIFTSIISEEYLKQNSLINMKLAYRYTFQDAINFITEILKDKDLLSINSRINNITDILYSNAGKKIDPNIFQQISKETRQIPIELERLSKKHEEHAILMKELLENNVEISDIQQIGYRKTQLNIFKKLLEDDVFFAVEQDKFGKGKELVWQNFFENNDWILGYGMTSIFHSSMEDKKIEQVVAGFEFNSSGKRIDALMKSKGFIESFCFVELKTHKTELLHKDQYRKECWQPSYELTGAISQIQKTVQKAMKIIKEKTEIIDDKGNPTGEVVFNYIPKSYLIIGSLKEFETPNGINMPKYSSFELFRRNINAPEIITFDELFERAKFLAID